MNFTFMAIGYFLLLCIYFKLHSRMKLFSLGTVRSLLVLLLRFVRSDQCIIWSKANYSPLLQQDPFESSTYYSLYIKFSSLAGGNRHSIWSHVSTRFSNLYLLLVHSLASLGVLTCVCALVRTPLFPCVSFSCSKTWNLSQGSRQQTRAVIGSLGLFPSPRYHFIAKCPVSEKPLFDIFFPDVFIASGQKATYFMLPHYCWKQKSVCPFFFIFNVVCITYVFQSNCIIDHIICFKKNVC